MRRKPVFFRGHAESTELQTEQLTLYIERRERKKDFQLTITAIRAWDLQKTRELAVK